MNTGGILQPQIHNMTKKVCVCCSKLWWEMGWMPALALLHSVTSIICSKLIHSLVGERSAIFYEDIHMAMKISNISPKITAIWSTTLPPITWNSFGIWHKFLNVNEQCKCGNVSVVLLYVNTLCIQSNVCVNTCTEFLSTSIPEYKYVSVSKRYLLEFKQNHIFSQPNAAEI